MDHRLEDIGGLVLNRAVASPRDVESQREPEKLSAEDLLESWLAVVFWFGVKSRSLHRSLIGLSLTFPPALSAKDVTSATRPTSRLTVHRGA